MPLAGEQLTIKEALALCNVVGFGSGPELVTAVAVMTAESGRYTEAWHDNVSDDDEVLSTDRGLFQINSVHDFKLPPAEAFDPEANATYAAKLSANGKDWTPWSAYNSGAYKKYMDAVRTVKQDGTWKSRVKMWQ